MWGCLETGSRIGLFFCRVNCSADDFLRFADWEASCGWIYANNVIGLMEVVRSQIMILIESIGGCGFQVMVFISWVVCGPFWFNPMFFCFWCFSLSDGA